MPLRFSERTKQFGVVGQGRKLKESWVFKIAFILLNCIIVIEVQICVKKKLLAFKVSTKYFIIKEKTYPVLVPLFTYQSLVLIGRLCSLLLNLSYFIWSSRFWLLSPPPPSSSHMMVPGDPSWWCLGDHEVLIPGIESRLPAYKACAPAL